MIKESSHDGDASREGDRRRPDLPSKGLSKARTEPEIRDCCESLNPAAVNVNDSGLTSGAPEIGGIGRIGGIGGC
jgi:hypothetical protein